jgi:hypothetical protein
MGRFVKGDVVVTPFPFSDLSDSKRRPALVAAALKGGDVILCQITSAEPLEMSIRFQSKTRTSPVAGSRNQATFAPIAFSPRIQGLFFIAPERFHMKRCRMS